jgi:hypothetical protein
MHAVQFLGLRRHVEEMALYGIIGVDRKMDWTPLIILQLKYSNKE